MKRFFVNQLVITALAVTAAFTSCDKNGDEEKIGNNKYLIAGKFKSQTNSGDAVFYVDYVSSVKSTVTEKELVGKIEDGDIIFKLSGVFDTENNKFYLSAGSSILVFQIVGTLSNGTMTNTEAAIKVKSGEEWTVHTVSVTSSDNVSIEGSTSNTQENGIPTKWFGNWKCIDDEGKPLYYTLTSWQFVYNEMPDEPAGFLDIVSLGNEKYEMTWEAYVYTESNGKILDIWIEYVKIWLEESEQGLVLTIFTDSLSKTYAEAKAYNTATSSAEEKLVITLTRP